MPAISRRSLIKTGLFAVCAPSSSLLSACGGSHGLRLKAADENGLLLPEGFSSRIIARSGEEVVPNSGFNWHAAPDGGACLPVPGQAATGWIYVCNSEMSNANGGVGAIRFDAQANVIDAYSILTGTSRNCAGGLTPWNTWLSCEEIDAGQVWECDPLGIQPALVRPALGRCNHEAVAVDPLNQQLYLTEDKPDGGLYRFTPASYPDLSSGQLDVATLVSSSANGVTLGWARIDDPDAVNDPLRYQHADMARFDGGEGIVYLDGRVYFTTKGDDSVWQYEVSSQIAVKVYDDDDHAVPILTGVDNITADAAGNLFVAEDGGDMQVVVLGHDGRISPIAQLQGHDSSEITGVAFSPDGTRLYFNSQRGESGASEDGITYEMRGPFAQI